MVVSDGRTVTVPFAKSSQSPWARTESVFEVPRERLGQTERFQMIGVFNLHELAARVPDPIPTSRILERDLHAWSSGASADGPINA